MCPQFACIWYRTWKQHVGASGNIRFGARNARCHALVRQRVRSRHNHKGWVAAPADCGLDAIDHFVERDNLLVRTVAAALGLCECRCEGEEIRGGGWGWVKVDVEDKW